MWILLIALIELARFSGVLWFLRSAGYFTGWFGLTLFLLIDWLFFFVVLPVLFHYFPLPRFSRGNSVGEWLRRRVRLVVSSNAPELVRNQPYVFASHSHGVLATTELLLFMLRPLSCLGIGDYTEITCTVSSQLFALPLTSLVCRALGGVPISQLHTLMSRSSSFLISPGGTLEISMVQFDDDKNIHIVKRTGFLHQCFLKKKPIVPLLTLGNHSMYWTPNFLRWLQWFSYKLIGYGMPLPALGDLGTVVPLRTASVEVVRLPTFTTLNDEENFEQYKERYYNALREEADSRGYALHCLSSVQALQKLASQ